MAISNDFPREQISPVEPKSGDIIAGKFTEFGKRIESAKVVGTPEAIERKQLAMMKYANIEIPANMTKLQNNQAQMLMGQVVVNSNNAVNTTIPSISKPTKEVIFITDVGKMKLKILDILVSVDSLAFCLILENEESLTYEPGIGYEFKLKVRKNDLNVKFDIEEDWAQGDYFVIPMIYLGQKFSHNDNILFILNHKPDNE